MIVDASPDDLPPGLRFLAGGGEATRLILKRDWTDHPLGPPQDWPEGLKVSLSTILNSPESLILCWGEEPLWFFFNETYFPLLGPRLDWAMGERFDRVWADGLDQAMPIVREAFAGNSRHFHNLPWKLDTDRGAADTWWSFSYSRILNGDGDIAGLFIFTNETTPTVQAEQLLNETNRRLSEREDFLSRVLAATTDCIKIVDADGKLTFMSEGGMQVMEIDDFANVAGCYWPDFLQEPGGAAAKAALDAALEGRSSHFTSDADTYLGTPKSWSISVSPIVDPDGRITRALAVSRDHTALKQAQDQQRLLNQELGHRLKNLLTIVQSVTGQTLRQSGTKEEAADAISARLVSLGAATSVLTQSAWEPALLADVVEAGLGAFPAARPRISLSGPPVRLDSQVTLAMTLAVHELATNATKYGALSNDDGVIDIHWDVSATGSDNPRFQFEWREQGGPPVVTPQRTGLGSRLIERSLRAYFRGTSELAYEPDGVRLRIDAPLGVAVSFA